MNTTTALPTTWEQVCEKLGIDANYRPDVSRLSARHAETVTSHFEAALVIDALNWNDEKNEPWFPDWQNDDEPKYEIWWDMEKDENNPSGFRLVYVRYYCTFSYVGSRLCFRSRELAVYAVKYFPDILRRYFKGK